MIRHERFQMMLAWPRELSPRERLQLDRHLADCPDCRATELMVTQNRAQLRTLTRPRPPQDIRSTLLEAADASHEAVSLYAPMVLAFLAVPLTGVALILMLAYGPVGVAGVITLLLAFALATAVHGERVGRTDGVLFLSRDALPWREFGRTIALDALGVAAGATLLGLVLLALALLSGSLP
jgi:anti-sigma factor RsiW